MNNIIDLLTTQECIIIYIVTGILCLLSILIYTFDSNKDNRRKKQNTKELNKIVESIEVLDVYEEYDNTEVPIIEPIKYDKKDEFIDKIAPTKEEVLEEKSFLDEMVQDTVIEELDVEEPKKVESEITLGVNQEVMEELDAEFDEDEAVSIVEELQYTTIEPNQEEAKRELENLTEKIRQDEIKKEEFFREETTEEISNNINLNTYEVEQEENAIISIDELNEKENELYQINETNQYKEEGNEPISLKDLEIKMNKQLETIAESFEINKVAEKPTTEEINEMLDGKTEVVEEVKKVKMDDFNTISTKKYIPTPFISPIFGIEKNNNTDIELENTANYDKLDEEIKKTNEYLMTMQELQSKID